MYFILEILGTIAFAISGAMVGIEKKMDILGVVVLGITTAVGGGIIRDIIIGEIPPAAFQKPVYVVVAIVVSIAVFVPAVNKRIDINHPILIVIDAIGLGVFTALGVRAGLPYNTFLQVFLGTVTGVGGGVLRDMFATEKPMIFVKHFYACASIIGAVVCAILFRYDENAAMTAGVIVVFILRILAARFKWHLPKANR